MTEALSLAARGRIFETARTANTFLHKPVDDEMLLALYELYKWGPTSMNCQPGRIVFVRSSEAKERLKPALNPGNIDKAMAAPVVAIIAYDTQFFENLPTQFPPNPGAREMFAGNPALTLDTAVRNGTLQGAYLMIAARTLGLDVGPMSGFKPDVLNAAFFPDGQWKANFLVNLGWGDPSGVHPRGPRLPFKEVAKII